MNARAELAHLRHRREELTRRHEQALERVALFPNSVNERQRDELAEQIREVDSRLEELGVPSR
jgi:hypothetical protein